MKRTNIESHPHPVDSSHTEEVSVIQGELLRTLEMAENTCGVARDLRYQLAPILGDSDPTEGGQETGEPSCELVKQLRAIQLVELETLRVLADIKFRSQL